jgi:hypothetical protein
MLQSRAGQRHHRRQLALVKNVGVAWIPQLPGIVGQNMKTPRSRRDALNKPDDFILAVGQVEDGEHKLVYVRQPFQNEPEFAVESINYKLQELLSRGQSPA